MSADDTGVAQSRSCGHCGGKMELLTYIPKRHGHPAYAVFECPGCGVIEWVGYDDQAP
jgi:hypothetical protein